MSIRRHAKRIIKRIGRAFDSNYDTVIETNNRSVDTNNYIRSLSESQAVFNRDYWNISFPLLKYYYYNSIAQGVHSLLFEKYRGCNKGKELVIVACGPSVDNYKPLKNVKHLAVNRAFLLRDVKFDYIFMHDSVMIENYRKELKDYNAEKFMAFATNIYNSDHFNASSADVDNIGARRFLISDPAIIETGGGQFDIIQPDITKGMILDRGGGTVFSALQFALFTEPKTIYLVGCDCTDSGYFKKAGKGIKQNLLEKTEYLWHEAKHFINQYYPDTEIVSINPVKLKGLFRDIEQS